MGREIISVTLKIENWKQPESESRNSLLLILGAVVDLIRVWKGTGTTTHWVCLCVDCLEAKEASVGLLGVWEPTEFEYS